MDTPHEFFIPGIKPEHWADMLNRVREAHKLDDASAYRLLHSITYVHDGNTCTETVGEPSPSNGEMIHLIVQPSGEGGFCWVMTEWRGARGGLPLLADPPTSVVLMQQPPF